MRFDLKKPCKNCPFRRGDGAVRLTEGRIHEVWAAATHSGPTFQCHNTIDYDASEIHEDEDGRALGIVSKGEPQHCIGAVIAGFNSGEGPNQLTRIAGRLGMIDIKAVEAAAADVFSSKDEMMETAIWRGRFT